MYAYVESGSVLKIANKLPKRWANVSNFDTLPSSSAMSYGWFPLLVEDILPLGFDETYDTPIYTINSTSVTESRQKRQRTQEEQDFVVSQSWEFIRAERDQKLLDCDWTELGDSPTNSNKTAWRKYRTELRDITKQSLKTDGSGSFHVVWPIPPKYPE